MEVNTLRIIKIKIMNWFYSGMLSLAESESVSSFKKKMDFSGSGAA